jgi:hypothetical protein
MPYKLLEVALNKDDPWQDHMRRGYLHTIPLLLPPPCRSQWQPPPPGLRRGRRSVGVTDSHAEYQTGHGTEGGDAMDPDRWITGSDI